MPTEPNPAKLDSYLTQLRRDMPELGAARSVLVESGQYNDVVIVDDLLVARFPKRAAHIADARRAARLLERIHARLPLPVPRPTLTLLTDRSVGSAYVAYAAIPGVPFHTDVWESLGGQAQTRVVGQLAAFLRALHGVDLPDIEQLGTPRADAAEWDRMGADIRERLFPHMRPSARMEVEELFDALARAEFTPALIHGDFGTANLLYDTSCGRISGVIDFDGACIGDPATDVAALMSYGDDFTARFAEAYGCSDDLLARARLYRATFALQEALFGIQHADPGAFAAGIADYA